MKIIFATGNKHKFEEIKHKIGDFLNLVNLDDIGFYGEMPETHYTLEENAAEKAFFIYNRFNISCFADDTGLEIEALSGRPGVFSARYAGRIASSESNIIKVLSEMKNEINRIAQFRTVIALVENERLYKFEGRIVGTITNKKRGRMGFGYDSIFIPDGYNKTFAEMTLEEKNSISHRTIAVNKLVDYLSNKYKRV